MIMATPVSEGTLLWEASEEVKQQANITQYMKWLEREKGLRFEDPEKLWEWSVTNIEDFWASLWDYFHVKASKPYRAVLSGLSGSPALNSIMPSMYFAMRLPAAPL
jgi:acetoacetyl-CoA synthetase